MSTAHPWPFDEPVVSTGRGKSAASMAPIEAAREILSEIAPCSVRAVAYQLFNRKLIPDMSKASTKRVSEQLVWARENGHIDRDNVTDETRTPEYNTGWSSASASIKHTGRGRSSRQLARAAAPRAMRTGTCDLHQSSFDGRGHHKHFGRQ